MRKSVIDPEDIDNEIFDDENDFETPLDDLGGLDNLDDYDDDEF